MTDEAPPSRPWSRLTSRSWRAPRLGRESTLLVVAAVLVALGLLAILLAWRGAAGTVLLTEQLPYLISGGLLGVALVVIGSLAYFGHLQSGTIRDARAREREEIRRHDEVMEAIRRATGSVDDAGS